MVSPHRTLTHWQTFRDILPILKRMTLISTEIMGKCTCEVSKTLTCPTCVFMSHLLMSYKAGLATGRDSNAPHEYKPTQWWEDVWGWVKK